MMFNFRMFSDVFNDVINITDVQFQKKKHLVRKKGFNSNSHIRHTPQFWPTFARKKCVLYAQIYSTLVTWCPRRHSYRCYVFELHANTSSSYLCITVHIHVLPVHTCIYNTCMHLYISDM